MFKPPMQIEQEILEEFDKEFKEKFSLLGIELEGITKPLKEFILSTLAKQRQALKQELMGKVEGMKTPESKMGSQRQTNSSQIFDW